jgi:predicted O-methyltransferase YrrM
MDIIYLIKPDSINYKITNKKLLHKYTNNKIYDEYINLIKEVLLKRKNDKDISYYYNSTRFFSLGNTVKSPIVDYLIKILDIQRYYTYYSYNPTKDNINNTKNTKNIKMSYVINDKSDDFKLYMYNCKSSDLLYKHKINFIKNIFIKLNNGDNIIFYSDNHCDDDYGINLYYILSLIFEKVFILNAKIVYCLNYNKKSKYIKYITDYDDTKNVYLDIEPKPDIDDFKKYLINIYQSYIKLYKLILKKDEDKIFIETYNFYTSFMKDTFIRENDKENLYHIYLEQFIIETFRRLYLTNNKNSKDSNKNSKEVKIHSAIKKDEGREIQKIIKKNKFKKCLEIGMAFGISAFYILTATKNVSLISIDPFQKDPKQWDSSGLNLIKKLDIEEKHHFIEDKSYIALPQLLNTYGENYFDFIFIDGWHTFDYTLIDFFYADKLLRKDGIILIDDALHKGVEKFIKYIETNYKNYKKIVTTVTQACFIKINEDSREWFFHSGF